MKLQQILTIVGFGLLLNTNISIASMNKKTAIIAGSTGGVTASVVAVTLAKLYAKSLGFIKFEFNGESIKATNLIEFKEMLIEKGLGQGPINKIIYAISKTLKQYADDSVVAKNIKFFINKNGDAITIKTNLEDAEENNITIKLNGKQAMYHPSIKGFSEENINNSLKENELFYGDKTDTEIENNQAIDAAGNIVEETILSDEI